MPGENGHVVAQPEPIRMPINGQTHRTRLRDLQRLRQMQDPEILALFKRLYGAHTDEGFNRLESDHRSNNYRAQDWLCLAKTWPGGGEFAQKLNHGHRAMRRIRKPARGAPTQEVDYRASYPGSDPYTQHIWSAPYDLRIKHPGGTESTRQVDPRARLLAAIGSSYTYDIWKSYVAFERIDAAPKRQLTSLTPEDRQKLTGRSSSARANAKVQQKPRPKPVRLTLAQRLQDNRLTILHALLSTLFPNEAPPTQASPSTKAQTPLSGLLTQYKKHHKLLLSILLHDPKIFRRILEVTDPTAPDGPAILHFIFRHLPSHLHAALVLAHAQDKPTFREFLWTNYPNYLQNILHSRHGEALVDCFLKTIRNSRPPKRPNTWWPSKKDKKQRASEARVYHQWKANKSKAQRTLEKQAHEAYIFRLQYQRAEQKLQMTKGHLNQKTADFLANNPQALLQYLTILNPEDKDTPTHIAFLLKHPKLWRAFEKVLDREVLTPKEETSLSEESSEGSDTASSLANTFRALLPSLTQAMHRSPEHVTPQIFLKALRKNPKYRIEIVNRFIQHPVKNNLKLYLPKRLYNLLLRWGWMQPAIWKAHQHILLADQLYNVVAPKPMTHPGEEAFNYTPTIRFNAVMGSLKTFSPQFLHPVYNDDPVIYGRSLDLAIAHAKTPQGKRLLRFLLAAPRPKFFTELVLNRAALAENRDFAATLWQSTSARKALTETFSPEHYAAFFDCLINLDLNTVPGQAALKQLLKAAPTDFLLQHVLPYTNARDPKLNAFLWKHKPTRKRLWKLLGTEQTHTVMESYKALAPNSRPKNSTMTRLMSLYDVTSSQDLKAVLDSNKKKTRFTAAIKHDPHLFLLCLGKLGMDSYSQTAWNLLKSLFKTPHPLAEFVQTLADGKNRTTIQNLQSRIATLTNLISADDATLIEDIIRCAKVKAVREATYLEPHLGETDPAVKRVLVTERSEALTALAQYEPQQFGTQVSTLTTGVPDDSADPHLLAIVKPITALQQANSPASLRAVFEAYGEKPEFKNVLYQDTEYSWLAHTIAHLENDEDSAQVVKYYLNDTRLKPMLLSYLEQCIDQHTLPAALPILLETMKEAGDIDATLLVKMALLSPNDRYEGFAPAGEPLAPATPAQTAEALRLATYQQALQSLLRNDQNHRWLAHIVSDLRDDDQSAIVINYFLNDPQLKPMFLSYIEHCIDAHTPPVALPRINDAIEQLGDTEYDAIDELLLDKLNLYTTDNLVGYVTAATTTQPALIALIQADPRLFDRFLAELQTLDEKDRLTEEAQKILATFPVDRCFQASLAATAKTGTLAMLFKALPSDIDSKGVFAQALVRHVAADPERLAACIRCLDDAPDQTDTAGPNQTIIYHLFLTSLIKNKNTDLWLTTIENSAQAFFDPALDAQAQVEKAQSEIDELTADNKLSQDTEIKQAQAALAEATRQLKQAQQLSAKPNTAPSPTYSDIDLKLQIHSQTICAFFRAIDDNTFKPNLTADFPGRLGKIRTLLKLFQQTHSVDTGGGVSFQLDRQAYTSPSDTDSNASSTPRRLSHVFSSPGLPSADRDESSLTSFASPIGRQRTPYTKADQLLDLDAQRRATTPQEPDADALLREAETQGNADDEFDADALLATVPALQRSRGTTPMSAADKLLQEAEAVKNTDDTSLDADALLAGLTASSGTASRLLEGSADYLLRGVERRNSADRLLGSDDEQETPADALLRQEREAQLARDTDIGAALAREEAGECVLGDVDELLRYADAGINDADRLLEENERSGVVSGRPTTRQPSPSLSPIAYRA